LHKIVAGWQLSRFWYGDAFAVLLKPRRMGMSQEDITRTQGFVNIRALYETTEVESCGAERDSKPHSCSSLLRATRFFPGWVTWTRNYSHTLSPPFLFSIVKGWSHNTQSLDKTACTLYWGHSHPNASLKNKNRYWLQTWGVDMRAWDRSLKLDSCRRETRALLRGLFSIAVSPIFCHMRLKLPASSPVLGFR
jgi:hypothetical protein